MGISGEQGERLFGAAAVLRQPEARGIVLSDLSVLTRAAAHSEASALPPVIWEIFSLKGRSVGF